MKIVIPIEPRTKKNSQQIVMVKGRPIIMPSKIYKKYEKDCFEYITDDQKLNIDYPVEVRCHFFLGTHRKCDLTNLLQAVDDILVMAGVLSDDNYSIICSHDGSRVFYDKENPRTEIEICQKTEDFI